MADQQDKGVYVKKIEHRFGVSESIVMEEQLDDVAPSRYEEVYNAFVAAEERIRSNFRITTNSSPDMFRAKKEATEPSLGR